MVTHFITRKSSSKTKTVLFNRYILKDWKTINQTGRVISAKKRYPLNGGIPLVTSKYSPNGVKNLIWYETKKAKNIAAKSDNTVIKGTKNSILDELAFT